MLPSHFRKTLGLEIGDMVSDELTTFREAMLRAGMECLLGKATGIDGNATGDTAIPITASQDYVVTRILTGNVSGSFSSLAGSIYTDVNGGGGNLLNFSLNSFVLRQSVFYNNTYGDLSDGTNRYSLPILNAENLYVNLSVANGSALTFDVLVFGIYADPV